MNLTSITAISPIDGRYRNKVENLQNYFSEFSLIKYRIYVEIEYFIALTELPLEQLKEFDAGKTDVLRQIVKSFTTKDAEKIKEIEGITNHDVKAVEYFLKNKFDDLKLSKYKEFIHFGLTSQDINNTAVPLSYMEAIETEIMPLIRNIITVLSDLSEKWRRIPMLARTHGQPASPTSLGKEIFVFAERLIHQYSDLQSVLFSTKFGGATGNFNAHHVAYPDINWVQFANDFVEKLGLVRQQTTTQIEHYDDLAASFHSFQRINTILIDLNRDIWSYISFDYFKQKIKKGEVGSSTMPHKVNPIDFENSEGNLGMANAFFGYLAEKLPISRLQRDLTDSTVSRNIGVPMAHSVIAYYSLLKGLDKLVLNEEKVKEELENNWAVVGEAIQTILRREGVANPYELLKDLTRKNDRINKDNLHEFIDNLDVSDSVKKELKKISPQNYFGIISF